MKGSNASSTRYAKVVPESTIVSLEFDDAKTAGSIGKACPLMAMLTIFKL